MYYSSGNYEAFARPRKPEGVEHKHAYLVGAGLASLAAAGFLVRDGQMPGENITILEASDIAGGALDGVEDPHRDGFLIRGGREMENHFECLWDLFHSVPSLETEGASVLDEFYWLNKDDPNYSLMRATRNRGEDGGTDGKFDLSLKAQKDLLDLFMSRDEDLYDKRINDVMGREFFDSTFWLYWRTMFAFEEWHSALEMKLYVQRFIHHIGGLPDFSALKFTKYNQYESLVKPLIAWLQEQGVKVQFDTRVTNVVFDITAQKKTARRIEWLRGGEKGGVDIDEDTLVFVTNGSLVDNSSWGTKDTAPEWDYSTPEGGAWSLWKNIAQQDPDFGRPDKFIHAPNVHAEHETAWESATITTLDDKITPYIEKICRRDPHSGRVVTGGIVTARDSAWLQSWTINRQPHFAAQKPNELTIWFYGLFIDAPGDFIKKPMRECTGDEICQEWLYHLGVPEEQIPQLAKESCITRPCAMPFVTAFFMPRTAGDRPQVVPENVTNFAFLGQFAETVRDTIFTTEYSVRTAMEAVYQLLDVERGVPEVWGSVYDVRDLLHATTAVRDGKPLPVPGWLRKQLDKTMVGDMLERYGVMKQA